MPEDRRPLTKEEIEESIRFAAGVSAAAGYFVGDEVQDEARRALRGEITFDEAVERVARRVLGRAKDEDEPGATGR